MVEETGDTKFWIEDAWGAGEVSTRVRLPMMECAQCVLQWTYRSGTIINSFLDFLRIIF